MRSLIPGLEQDAPRHGGMGPALELQEAGGPQGAGSFSPPPSSSPTKGAPGWNTPHPQASLWTGSPLPTPWDSLRGLLPRRMLATQRCHLPPAFHALYPLLPVLHEKGQTPQSWGFALEGPVLCQ